MDFMASRRIVYTSLGILVILNLGLLGTLWWQNFRPQEKPEQESFFQRKLNLTDEQNARFTELRREHFKASIPLVMQITSLKKELIAESLKEKPDSRTIVMLSDRIGRSHAMLERNLARHFHNMSGVCTAEQRDSLKLILEKATLISRNQNHTPKTKSQQE